MSALTVEAPTAPILKKCGCGREHTAEQWAALKLHGWFGIAWRGSDFIAAELRTCPCGSTIAIECVAPKRMADANAELERKQLRAVELDQNPSHHGGS